MSPSLPNRKDYCTVNICTYCGEPADTMDHLIPVSYQTSERNLSGSARHRSSLGPTVPACMECNGVLGNRMFDTLADRAKYVEKSYRRRYKKLLASPKWTVDELLEVGPSLRASIMQDAGKRLQVEEQIAHAMRLAHTKAEALPLRDTSVEAGNPVKEGPPVVGKKFISPPPEIAVAPVQGNPQRPLGDFLNDTSRIGRAGLWVAQ